MRAPRQTQATAQVILDRGPITRDEISRHLELGTASVSKLTRDLIDWGVIKEDGFKGSNGGRPAALLKVNPDRGMVIGVEVSSMRIAGLVVDLGGSVIQRAERAGAMGRNEDEVLAAVFELVDDLVQRCPEDRLLGLGLGICGIVSRRTQISTEFPRLKGWKDVPVGRLLGERYQLPVEVENDVRAATVGEWRHGEGKAWQDLLYLHVGQGIAVGIIIDGTPYSGAAGIAGELGHTVIEPSGPVCYCGNYGCLESLASPPAMLLQCVDALEKGAQSAVRQTAQGQLDRITAEMIFQAAEKGDRLACNLVDKAGTYIGYAIANLVNVFDPEALILGGALANHSRLLRETVERTFRAKVLPSIGENVVVVESGLKQDACAIGAAALAIERAVADVGQFAPAEVAAS